jgi:outer membrane receptor protein involved in Fe transport
MEVVARGRTQAASGSIEGTVTDMSGAIVPDAKVVARNLQTGFSREASSNNDGLYRLTLLPVGNYDVTIEKQGFTSLQRTGIKVQVGELVVLDVQVAAAGASERVNVTAESPVIEATRTDVAAAVNDRAVANLPTNGRNFIDFVLLTPGVARDAARTGDISFGGQRGTLNSLQIDGADNNNTFFGQALGRTGSGRAPYQFSQDAVQEFQVNTNGYSAEYGRAGGAVINVVTKSGNNQFHGTAFEFYRERSLNANTFFNNAAGRFTSNPAAGPPSVVVPSGSPLDGKLLRPVPALHVNQFGGNIGGPIVKDKAFFFFDYDGQRQVDPVNVILGGTRVGPSDPNFAAQQLALSEIASHTTTYPRLFNQNVYLLKGDWQVSTSNRFSARWNHQGFVGGALENTAAPGTPTTNSAFDHTGNSSVKTDTLTFTLASVISNRIVNEARFQWARDSEPGTANSDDPETNINQGGAVISFGRNNFSPRETTEHRYQFIDNVSFQLGRHGFKTGIDVNLDNILNFFPGLFGGQYNFNSLADFANKKPASFVQAFAGNGTSGGTTHPDIHEVGLYGQDEWRVNSRLTLNLGLRWDLELLKSPAITNPDSGLLAAGINTGQVNTDYRDFGPRLGFAWNPLASNRLVVRGGYGLFYGRTPAIMLGTATSQNGIQVINVTFTGAAMPVYPARFSSLPSGITTPAPNIYFFDPRYKSPYTSQWSLGVEYELAKDTSMTIGYIGVKGTHLQRTRDINLLPPIPTQIQDASGNTFVFLRFPGRRFTNFGRISEFESSADSVYNGLTISINKRFTKGFQFLASYTYSKVIDDAPDGTSVVPFNGGDDAKMTQNPLNPAADRGLGVTDIRNRLVLSGIWDLGGYAAKVSNAWARTLLTGWSFSGILSMQSGSPYSATVGADLNNDSNRFTDRVPGFGRNTFTGPNFYSLDPRITREFRFREYARLQLIGEGFNILNRANFNNVRTTFYNVTGAFPNQKLVLAPGFGQAQGTFNPRILQLAAKIIF